MQSRRTAKKISQFKVGIREKSKVCLAAAFAPLQPSGRACERDIMLESPIAKEQLGLSLRLRGGGAPDSKGKGAQQHRSAAVAAAPSPVAALLRTPLRASSLPLQQRTDHPSRDR